MRERERRKIFDSFTSFFLSFSPLHIYLFSCMPNIKSISHLSSIRTAILATLSLASSIYGHPLSQYTTTNQEVAGEEPEVDYGSAEFYEKLVIIMALVLIGGAFAGTLTCAYVEFWHVFKLYCLLL